MLDRIFFSLHARWSLISSNKHGIYVLTQELLNNLRLKILEK